tara:strand:- start:1159 stop:1788 length:630 start_codon:yes stop_codon:yes gene_type:complete
MVLDVTKLDNVSSYSKHKLNFFAVTKCAGTAIKASLLKQKVISSTSLRYDYIYDHPEATYITKEHASLMSDEWLNFSVIRHPYIRFTSLYKHFIIRDPLRRKELHPHLQQHGGLDYFADFLFNNTDDQTCNHHMKSISSFLLDKNDVIIPDIVFMFDEEYKTIIDFLNSYGCTLEKANVSNIDLELSSYTKRLITERYALDFETFNFEE